jgi:hypothetical protein
MRWRVVSGAGEEGRRLADEPFSGEWVIITYQLFGRNDRQLIQCHISREQALPSF